MKAKVLYRGGMHFEGETGTGHKIHFDSKPHGEPTAGPAPMETFLQAVAACSAMDVAVILIKRRKTIDRFELEVEAQRNEEHPKIFKTLHVIYRLWGPDITSGEVEKAVELSHDKYCSILNMLKPDVKVTRGVEVNPV